MNYGYQQQQRFKEIGPLEGNTFVEEPLQFNRNHGKPPMPRESSQLDQQCADTTESCMAVNLSSMTSRNNTYAGSSGQQGLTIGPQAVPPGMTERQVIGGQGTSGVMGGQGIMAQGMGGQNMMVQGMGGQGMMAQGLGSQAVISQGMGGQGMGGQGMGGQGMMMAQVMGGQGIMTQGIGGMMTQGAGPGMAQGSQNYNWGMMNSGDPTVMIIMEPAQEVDGKEPVNFNGFVMVPPPPHAPPRSTRERPPGCRTAFLGGLPETVTEEMITNLMETCGAIESVRLSKKNFAHVRFHEHDSVEKAIFYSGWRMKIGDKDDKPNTGRIHVDYATARDDQYEWECHERAMYREMRHQQRMEEDRLKGPSPPPVIRFSDVEAARITEMLKTPEGFQEGSNVLLQWLSKGEISSRNANRFYSLMHSVNSSLRRLVGEKEEFEQELLNYKLQYQQKVAGLIAQMEQIESLFQKAHQQKVWDHFTKPQRKNLDMWTKQCQEIKQKHHEELLAGRHEDEMELSDTDEPTTKKHKAHDIGQLNHLKDENDSLKCQLEAYRNEVDMNKQEYTAAATLKERQIEMMQKTFKNIQEQMLQAKEEARQLKLEQIELRAKAAAASVESSSSVSVKKEGESIDNGLARGEASDVQSQSAHIEPSSSTVPLSQRDGLLLGLICVFLHAHPFGASVDYMWSYLQRGGITVKSNHIETLLESFPKQFEQKLCGVGVNFEKRWVFTGFSELSSSVDDHL